MTSERVPSSDSRPGNRGDYVRVVANLTYSSVAAIEKICSITGDSKTDAINRALQIYAFVVGAAGRDEQIFIEVSKGKFEKIELS